MTQPGETIQVECLHCRKQFKVPAGRRRRAIRLRLAIADFCSKKCNQSFVSKMGKKAQSDQIQKELEKIQNGNRPNHRPDDLPPTPPSS